MYNILIRCIPTYLLYKIYLNENKCIQKKIIWLFIKNNSQHIILNIKIIFENKINKMTENIKFCNYIIFIVLHNNWLFRNLHDKKTLQHVYTFNDILNLKIKYLHFLI
jgi:hypothetical protein